MNNIKKEIEEIVSRETGDMFPVIFHETNLIDELVEYITQKTTTPPSSHMESGHLQSESYYAPTPSQLRRLSQVTNSNYAYLLKRCRVAFPARSWNVLWEESPQGSALFEKVSGKWQGFEL